MNKHAILIVLRNTTKCDTRKSIYYNFVMNLSKLTVRN